MLPRHVRLGALTGQSIEQGSTVLAGDDQTLEVREDDIKVVIEKDVVQTDIAVDDALEVHEGQCVHELLAPLEAALECRAWVVLDVVAERAVGVVLQNETVFGKTLGFDDSGVRAYDLQDAVLHFDTH